MPGPLLLTIFSNDLDDGILSNIKLTDDIKVCEYGVVAYEEV